MINIKGKVREYLPRILSIVPYGRPTKEIQRNLISPLKEKLKQKARKSSANHRKLTSEESLTIAADLVPPFSDCRLRRNTSLGSARPCFPSFVQLAQSHAVSFGVRWYIYRPRLTHPNVSPLVICPPQAPHETKWRSGNAVFAPVQAVVTGEPRGVQAGVKGAGA